MHNMSLITLTVEQCASNWRKTLHRTKLLLIDVRLDTKTINVSFECHRKSVEAQCSPTDYKPARGRGSWEYHGSHRNAAEMEANFAGFLWRWKDMSRDSRGDVKNLYGITAEG